MKDFDKAIELNPYYAKAYYRRGKVKLVLGDKKGADEDLEISAKLENQK